MSRHARKARQRPDGSWRGQLTLASGRKKDFRSKTYAEARTKLARLIRERDMGIDLQTDERLTVASFLAGWLERRKPRLRASTHRRYSEQLAHIIRGVGRVKLTKLTASQVERVYADLLESGQSTTSVAHIHTVLKGAMKDAMRKHVVAINICELVTAPREGITRSILSTKSRPTPS